MHLPCKSDDFSSWKCWCRCRSSIAQRRQSVELHFVYLLTVNAKLFRLIHLLLTLLTAHFSPKFNGIQTVGTIVFHMDKDYKRYKYNIVYDFKDGMMMSAEGPQTIAHSCLSDCPVIYIGFCLKNIFHYCSRLLKRLKTAFIYL